MILTLLTTFPLCHRSEDPFSSESLFSPSWRDWHYEWTKMLIILYNFDHLWHFIWYFWHLFAIFFRHASVSRTYPCKLVGQLVSWSVTLSDFQSLLSDGRSNKKKYKKTKSIYFLIFLLGGPVNWSPTHSTGPQPIQLVPKNCFLQKSQYRSLK